MRNHFRHNRPAPNSALPMSTDDQEFFTKAKNSLKLEEISDETYLALLNLLQRFEQAVVPMARKVAGDQIHNLLCKIKRGVEQAAPSQESIVQTQETAEEDLNRPVTDAELQQLSKMVSKVPTLSCYCYEHPGFSPGNGWNYTFSDQFGNNFLGMTDGNRDYSVSFSEYGLHSTYLDHIIPLSLPPLQVLRLAEELFALDAKKYQESIVQTQETATESRQKEMAAWYLDHQEHVPYGENGIVVRSMNGESVKIVRKSGGLFFEWDGVRDFTLSPEGLIRNRGDISLLLPSEKNLSFVKGLVFEEDPTATSQESVV